MAGDAPLQAPRYTVNRPITEQLNRVQRDRQRHKASAGEAQAAVQPFQHQGRWACNLALCPFADRIPQRRGANNRQRLRWHGFTLPCRVVMAAGLSWSTTTTHSVFNSPSAQAKATASAASSAERFLAEMPAQPAACLLSDIRIPGRQSGAATAGRTDAAPPHCAGAGCHRAWRRVPMANSNNAQRGAPFLREETVRRRSAHSQ